MAYKKVKYTGEKKITSLIGPEGVVEWNKGDVQEVVESKVRNHIKYPHWELVEEGEKEWGTGGGGFKEPVVKKVLKKKAVKKSK